MIELVKEEKRNCFGLKIPFVIKRNDCRTHDAWTTTLKNGLSVKRREENTSCFMTLWDIYHTFEKNTGSALGNLRYPSCTASHFIVVMLWKHCYIFVVVSFPPDPGNVLYICLYMRSFKFKNQYVLFVKSQLRKI